MIRRHVRRERETLQFRELLDAHDRPFFSVWQNGCLIGDIRQEDGRWYYREAYAPDAIWHPVESRIRAEVSLLRPRFGPKRKATS